MTAVGGLTKECPPPWSNEIVLPTTGLPKWSFRVTETIDEADPSAAVAVGFATTDDCDPSAGPAVKVTDKGCGVTRVMLSVLSVTVNDTVSASVFSAWKLATPLLSVSPPWVPPLGTRAVISTFTSGVVGVTETILFGRTWSAESLMLTKKLAVAVPSAASVVGLTVTVDSVADGLGGGGTEKVTMATGVKDTPSVTSCALNVTVSATLSVTVKMAVPLGPVITGLVGVIAGGPLPVPDRVTFLAATA